MTILWVAALTAVHARPALAINDNLTNMLVWITLIITVFLVLLNAICAFLFRKRRLVEVLTYIASAVLEAGIFVFVLLLRLGILTHVPFHLPPGLPINRAELGATLTIAIGLFPVAYWHRTSIAQWRARMEKDAQTMKNREAGVRIRSNAPGEWLN